jgi:uncharacterized protein YigE (DUF2233 family)
MKFSLCFLLFGFAATIYSQSGSLETVQVYTVDPQSMPIEFFWKNDSGSCLRSFENLKIHIAKKKKTLLFAMNGGMYKPDYSPVGLFIQDFRTITPLNLRKCNANFCMKPNGVFYITAEKEAFVCVSEQFVNKGNVKFATQSGPMLLINGYIHPSFRPNSHNLNIRNGVGILPDKRVIFAISKGLINFYDFALYFKSLGCKDALYLDGFVSRAFIPEKNWTLMDGNFGVIIGVAK